jgi:Eco57I restriction-modification methylase
MSTGRHYSFTSVRTEGAILPADLLQRIVDGDQELGGLTEESYHLAAGEKLNEAINRAWNRLLGGWATFKSSSAKLPPGDPGTTVTRERWLYPLFQELGYGRLVAAKGLEANGKSYPISHLWNNTPNHLVGCNVDLDTRSPGVAGAARTSPHGLVQEFLNRSDAFLWGFVANGLRLRLLRDNISLTRQAYVEFDLEAMMEGEIYADFVLLWLVCHESRVEAARPEECWLEKWSRAAQDQGVRALDELRNGVKQAINALGTGFLQHPANRLLVEKLRRGNLSEQDYYRQLLRLVYRLIFLFVAEERGLLLDPKTALTARERYTRFYSIARLRHLAERQLGTRHTDLWQALRLVMEMLGSDTGCPELGLPALASFLFLDQAIPDLIGCELANRDLLAAIRGLAFTEQGRTRRIVDYKNLRAEELGSVYEALLEEHPQLELDASKFELVKVVGSERKTTGSYYTPESLVQTLLDSALAPVIEDSLKEADPDAALLDLKVCDPACGSGHFLIAAAHRIAKQLASVRTGDAEPSPEATRTALREVIARCIYGVDVNPLAVELCKVSLWMEALDPGKPLSFLENRIVCGNSLIGVSPGLDISEIPDEAFNPVTGDHKPTASALKKRNKAERKGQESLRLTVLNTLEDLSGWVAEHARQVSAMPEESVPQLHSKEHAYQDFRQSPEYKRRKLEYDLWTAAFFWPIKEPENALDIVAPTQSELARLRLGEPLNPELVHVIHKLADRLRFFHWPLEFPEVFDQGGFKCVLSNPPWERIKLQEEEFFATRDPNIANAPNKAARQKLIDALPESNAAFAREFEDAKHEAEATSRFVRESNRFPRTSVGDVNTYAIFAEHAYSVQDRKGRSGIILPTGIITDDTTKEFFSNLVDNRGLAQVYGFENEAYIFPAVHHALKFCTFTVAGDQIQIDHADFIFFVRYFEQLRDTERHFELSRDDFLLINPNTSTCPIFRTRADAELTRNIYRRVPALLNVRTEENLWAIRLIRVFDMNQRRIIEQARTFEQLHSDGISLDERGRFYKEQTTYLPVMESKLMYQYNHRFASYSGCSLEEKRKGQPREATVKELESASFLSLPRYWLPINAFPSAMQFLCERKWLIGYRNFTNATNERTLIATILPFTATDFPMRVMVSERSARECTLLLANLEALPLDYVARQKIGGTDMSSFILKQLPVLPPTAYTAADIGFIAPRVFELIYTAWDVKGFGDGMWQDAKDQEGFRDLIQRQWEENRAATGGHKWEPPEWAEIELDGIPLPPFKWDEQRRAQLRAELDAYYAKLYGLTRDELRYILDPQDVYGPDFPGETFRVLKEKEIRQYGEYRTRRLVLEWWDEQESQRYAVERIAEPAPIAVKIPVEPDIKKPLPEITWIPISSATSQVPTKTLSPNYRQAVGVAWLLENFGTGPSIPLFDVAKYSYFMQRANLADMDIEFREFARGPYDPQVKYRAGAYASKKSYWEVRGNNIVRKRNLKEAVNAANKVVADLESARRLVEKLGRMSKEDLGGLATVDFAGRAIYKRGEIISPENIRSYFLSDWQEKADNPWFTDENINRAINLLSELGLFEKHVVETTDA